MPTAGPAVGIFLLLLAMLKMSADHACQAWIKPAEFYWSSSIFACFRSPQISVLLVVLGSLQWQGRTWKHYQVRSSFLALYLHVMYMVFIMSSLSVCPLGMACWLTLCTGSECLCWRVRQTGPAPSSSQVRPSIHFSIHCRCQLHSMHLIDCSKLWPLSPNNHGQMLVYVTG